MERQPESNRPLLPTVDGVIKQSKQYEARTLKMIVLKTTHII